MPFRVWLRASASSLYIVMTMSDSTPSSPGRRAWGDRSRNLAPYLSGNSDGDMQVTAVCRKGTLRAEAAACEPGPEPRPTEPVAEPRASGSGPRCGSGSGCGSDSGVGSACVGLGACPGGGAGAAALGGEAGRDSGPAWSARSRSSASSGSKPASTRSSALASLSAPTESNPSSASVSQFDTSEGRRSVRPTRSSSALTSASAIWMARPPSATQTKVPRLAGPGDGRVRLRSTAGEDTQRRGSATDRARVPR